MVDEENPNYASYDNDLYSKNFEILYKCNKTGTVTLKEGVKEIKSGAFITNVTAINLPDSLEKISGWNLIPWSVNYLYIPKNVKEIDPTSFLYQKEIEVDKENEVYSSVNNKYLVDKDVKTLYWCSKNADNINDLPETIEILEKYSFYLCSNLKEVILNLGIKEVRQSCFGNCSKLEKVEIPNTVEKIYSYVFEESSNLTEIIIHKKRGEITGEPWGAVYGTRVITYDE